MIPQGAILLKANGKKNHEKNSKTMQHYKLS